MELSDGTFPRRPTWWVGLLWLVCLVCLVPAAYGAVALLPVSPVAAADRGRWQLPLEGRPRVVAPFAAPAGPYAPGHRGVDLAATPAARVLAAAAGTVAFAGRVAGRGVVSVDHPDGLRTTYEPVTAGVRAGDPVAAGAVLGLLSGVGGHCPPAACLHWGLRRGTDYLDPMALLGAVRVRLLPVWSVRALARTPVRAAEPQPGAAVAARPEGPGASSREPRPLAPGVVLLAGGPAALGWIATATRGPRRRAPPRSCRRRACWAA